MKTLVLALCLVLPGLSAAAAPELRESNTRRFTLGFPAGSGPRTLTVDNVQGRVQVTATERADVAVVVVETITARNAEALARARRETRLDPTPGPGRSVRLYADGPFRCHEDGAGGRDCRHGWNLPYDVRYDLTLEVPRDLDLDLSTVNGGELAVHGVRPAHFTLANVNGAIEVTGLTGEGTVETVNGELTVHFAANPTGKCRFATVNGDVELGLHRAAGAEITVENQNGEILSDFAVGAGSVQPVRVETEAGGRRVYRSSRPAFRIGAGGPTLELETVNGDVVLRDLDAPELHAPSQH